MNKPKRAALYSRFSTHNQDGNYSIDIQHERMEAMCKSKGWIVTEYFTDAAYSGANMDRPALQNLLSKLDEFDVVMVYRLDRLSRSQRDTMTLIQDYFLKNNVAFVSVSETLDTTTPFGMAMIGILAVFAELERATITERMQSGIRKRIESGYRLNGGNRMPTGYKKGTDENGESILVIDEIESEKVKRIFDLYEQYHSITKIQEILKQEGYARRKFSTIRQILSNTLYIGKVKYKDETFEGVHQPIITEEQFNRVQALLSRHPVGANFGKNKESLFGGLISCGHCGEIYTSYSYKVENKTKGDYYVRSYICRARRFPSEYDEKCLNKSWKNDDIENLFLFELSKITTNKHLDKQTKKKNSRNFDLAIKRIDEKIARSLDLFLEGDIDKSILNTKIEKLKAEKEFMLKEQAQEQTEMTLEMSLNEINTLILDFKKIDFSAKRAVVEKLLKHVTIYDDNIEFDWNF